MNTESENKLLARRLLEEVLNQREFDRLAEFLAPDYVADYGTIVGLQGARDHILVFLQCYPDFFVSVDGQVAEGDTVVTWFTMRGTHLGEFAGVPPTGRQITLHGINIQKIHSGRIVEQWGGSNSLEALLALGVVQWARKTGADSGFSSQQELR
jgi:steroid delta-isomerase-like uncharacterized protein